MSTYEDMINGRYQMGKQSTQTTTAKKKKKKKATENIAPVKTQSTYEKMVNGTYNKPANNTTVKQITTNNSGFFSEDTANAVKDFITNNKLANTWKEQFKTKELSDIWSNGYDFGDVSKTLLTGNRIFNPFVVTGEKLYNTGKKGIEKGKELVNSEGKFVKNSKAIDETKEELNNIWSNGYDFGDIRNTKNTIKKGALKTILGTGADVGTNLVKGELQTAEGLVDTGRYIASDLVRATGYNETADKIKERAIQNTTGFILGENDLYNNPKQDGWAKKIDEYSVFDQKIDQIGQSIGQQAFRIGLQKALMGNAQPGGSTDKLVKGINQLEIFAGSYGQAKSEAYMQGADDKTATTRGIISGTAEFISENLFDNVPGFKTSEMKSLTRLKDFIGSSTEKAMGKKAGQLITKFFGGFGEGVEEILSNALETTFTNVANYINPDYVYGMEEGQGIRDADNKVWKMFKDIYGSATSQESKDAFITSFFSTLITAGLTSSMNNKQRNQVINAYAKENNISTKQATELFDAIKDARLEQVVDEKTGYTERTELEEQATQQLVNEMQNNPELNLEELFLATPKNRQESQFVFTNDERKNIKSEQQKVLANDLQRINNTKEVHDTYNIVNRVQAINKTQQYHLTTTEGLYEMGIVNKNENGDYIMPNGTPYVPRGLNYGTNGDIYVNVDVGTQSGTQAMYHEMFEGFKKASPKQYETFKQMVRDIVGEQTIQDEVAQYKQMYGEELTDNIEDEIINDKFGELAENQKFINKIADNRSVLEKFVDSIKNMIKYVKGTPQERQLIKLQNKLEKEFAKRYKKTDFSQNEGETAYSLGKHYGDLGKGEDTFYGRMYDARRSTGHFGTGTYFVNEDYQPGEYSSYKNRPSQKVEFDNYDNLFKPSNRDEGFDLHDSLKEINYNNTPISQDLYNKLLPYYEGSFDTFNEILYADEDNDYKNIRNLLEQANVETESPQDYYESGRGQYGNSYEKYLENEITNVLNNYDRFQKAERDLKRILNLTDEQFNETIEKVRQTEKEYESHSYDQKLKDDSLSTIFMKSLGYNGVDVRGLEGLDNTEYGSVIYDLNKKAVKNTAFSLNKDALRDLSREINASFSELESNLDGRDRTGIRNYLQNHTGIIDQYLNENNIEVEPVYKDIEYTRVRTEELQDFVKKNNLNVTKLANNEELLNKYFDLWFGNNVNSDSANSWRRMFEFVKDNNDIPSPLKALDREMNYLNNGETQTLDEYATKHKKLDEAIDNGFDFWLEDKITSLLNKVEYDSDEVMEEAIANHGTTDDYNTGAYMTTDGQLLDFNDGGYRDDHRTISAFDLDMNEFMNYGAIRMKPEGNGFELAVEPTQAQYNRLEDYIDNYLKTNSGVHSDNSSIYVDVDKEGGYTYDTQTYSINTPTSKIINDIKEYYKTGKFPTKSRYSDFYSLQTNKDNTGKELSEGQKSYFKNSKIVDDEGNLKVVYHTTTDYTNQFNEFNPIGTPLYRYGDVAVNFYTDSKDMSSSYGHNMIAPYTQRIESMDDVSKQLGDRYRIQENNGKYELYDNNDETQLNNYKDLIKLFSSEEQDILNKTFNKSRSEVRSLLNNDDDQFDFYDRTRQKFLNMLSIMNDNKGVKQSGTNKTIDELIDTYLNENTIKPKKIFNNQEDLFRNITSELSPYEHYQYSGYVNITNPFIVDGENNNWNQIIMGTGDDKQKFKSKWAERYTEKLTPSVIYELRQDLNKIGYDLKSDKYGDLALFSGIVTDDLSNELAIDLESVEDVLSEIGTDLNNDSDVKLQTNDFVKYVLNLNERGANYDGVIFKNIKDYGEYSYGMDTEQANDVYVTFNSNQFKAIDNLNPTEDDDIRYSLTSNQNIDSKEIAPVNTTTEEQLAPIREDISNISNQLNNLSNQIETLQNGLENNPRGYVESYKEQRNENIPTKQLTEEEANLRQDALMNDEGYLKSLQEQANYDVNDKFIKSLTNDIQAQLSVDKYDRYRVENLIRDAVENNLSADEIRNRVEKDFSSYNETYNNEELKNVKQDIRSLKIKVPSGVKSEIADYRKFKDSNFGKITFSNYGQGIDVVYAQLSDMYPQYFPNDIINETDQLQKIAEVANTANNVVSKQYFDMDYLDDVSDYISDAVLNYKANNQIDSQASLDKDIQFGFTEDIAPTTIRTQESIDNYIDNRDIAPVNKQQVRPKSNLQTRAKNMYREIQQKFINRNYLGDKLAQATGNKYIKFAGDNLNNVSGETSFNINNNQTDINGNWLGKGVKPLFEPARKSGKYEMFNDYLVQKSNIERHNVGKGSQVPLEVSKQLVTQYEAENPEFKTWAKPIYKYFDNVLQQQVDAGLITQERYNDYRGENGIYRSYVPFYPGEIDTNRFYDNEGNLKPVSTLKRSKGGATDVNQMLSVEESMAKQTYALKRAIRMNEYYKQIISTMEKYDAMFDGDMRDNPTNLDDSLFTTDNGDKVLSAYIDGKKVSALISDELYNELSGDNEAKIKQFEQDFSLITKPLQKMSSVRRKLITSWNPAFLMRNAIKDVQDAVINSKHTKDMLANLTGTKKGSLPAIIELAQQKTPEAQQFLALYGAENLLGDYSVNRNNMSIAEQFQSDYINSINDKNMIRKFSRLNELIELAPRYAEFKASLQNGESVQEAIYNAREVTTNFGRGGYITKAMNRNGFTFLNANVQGLDKLVRNLSGENGVKGVVAVVTKGAFFAVLPSILNDLLYGFGDDKDEEYEALPDYIKDNYYLIKTEGNHFVRIPKGRINAVFGSAARRLMNTIETGENQFDGYLSNAWSQIGVGDLGGNNIFSPIIQAQLFKNDKEHPGKAWYGGDIVPTRLQKKPAEEQTDAKIDKISNFIGETFNLSPYKVNYVLDQYSGGIGDILLPMITDETTNGAEGVDEYLTAPLRDAFSVNSTDDNKYAGEFYDTKDKLEIIKNGANATEEDKLKYEYMSGISSQLSDLYKERREVQSDTTISNKKKYEKVQKIQDAINSLAKEAMSEYKNIKTTDNYSTIGDKEYYKNNKNEWTSVNDSDSEFTAGMTDTEKSSYYNVKSKISSINSNKSLEYAKKKSQITQAIVNSGLDNYSKAMLYSKYYSTQEKMNNVVNAGYDVDTYITALSDIDQIRNKYQVKKGYSVEFRKKKTIAYVNSLNMEVPQKAMLIREYYSSFRNYNKDIVKYVANLNISYEDKVAILNGTGMTVKGNNVSWK